MEYYRVKGSVIIRDERQLFDCGWYLVCDPSRPGTWNFDGPGFGLVSFLTKPRSAEEIARYGEGLPEANPLRAPERRQQIMRSLENMGIIARVSESESAARAACVPRQEQAWRYAPASGPVSAEVRLPMEGALLARVLAEMDRAGVLGICFVCGEGGLQSLAEMGPSLRCLRAALSIRLSDRQLGERGVEFLSGAANIGGRPPLVMLEASGTAEALRTAAKTLKDKRVPFCVIYRIGITTPREQVRELASAAVSEGAGFVVLEIDARNESGEADFEALKQQVAELQQIQRNYPRARVQARVLQAPIPKPSVEMGMQLRGLLMRYLGGCVAGMTLPPPGSAGDRRPAAEVPSPEYAQTMGPDLPPNCCQGGITHLAVDRDGLVYPCKEAVGLAGNVMGDLKQAPLAEVWASEKWAFFRGGWDLYQLEGCYNCGHYIECSCRRCRIGAEKAWGERLAPLQLCVDNAEAFKLFEANVAGLADSAAQAGRAEG